jgi:gamma-glutamyltranspeptidase/glutathione hydrolase
MPAKLRRGFGGLRAGILVLIAGCLCLPPATIAGQAVPPAAAIASAHPLASAAGHEMLAGGGNAFDAAITVASVLAVVEPYGSGLGGGGLWLLQRAGDGRPIMLDARERAPLAAHRDLYLDARGEVPARITVDGPLAAGIPGVPEALVHLAEHYARLPLARALAPAIRHARDGFSVDADYRRLAGIRLEALRRSPAAAAVFLREGEVPEEGASIRQPDLAKTLEAIAREGGDGFYRGAVAAKLVGGVRAAGGIWSLEDLAGYRVVERSPIRFRYGDVEVTAAAPPSSGGVALASMLNILAAFDLDALDRALRSHLIVEAMRRAYRDRAQYLGDPDFVPVPTQRLVHPFYAAGLRASIRPDRATPSASLPRFSGPPSQGADTTHFSILDRQGNRVAATLSINYPFGSGFVPPGTGVLLNDEMDDFSARPGWPNVYGLVGGEANAVAPGKRMLSSMTPVFLDDSDRVAILGTPGGSRIISMVLLATLDFAAGRDLRDWVAAPRFHHQYLPDVVEHEPGAFTPAEREALIQRGHTLRELARPYGNMQAVLWDRVAGHVSAASDPRGKGRAEVR